MYHTYEIFIIKTGFFNFLNYSYLIMDRATNSVAVVDPAWDMRKITDTISKIGGKLDAILLTHSHLDHTNLVEPLLTKYNPTVYISDKEAKFYNFSCRNLSTVSDFDIIKLGQTEISCIMTPGHTAGGVCYSLSDSLFTGDTIFIEGCGICNAAGGAAENMYDSIQKIKLMVSPESLVYPAHSYGKSPGYPLSYLINQNIYFQIDKKEYFISFRMRDGQKAIFNFK